MLEHARAEVESYLGRHPQERPRLSALTAQLTDDADPFARSNMSGHITASVLVFDSGLEHVLLIHHKLYSTWMQPGGHVEPSSNSLLESGRREVQEETGLSAAAVRPLLHGGALDIDTHRIAALPAKGEGEHQHHDFMFLAKTHHAFHPTPQLAEVNAVEWVPVGRFLQISGPRMQHLAPKVRDFLSQATKR